MLCFGFEHEAAESLAQKDPLSYGGCPLNASFLIWLRFH